MEQLQHQLQVLANQVAEQEARLAFANRFELTPNQIIRHFEEIKPFSGDGTYGLKSFLLSVQGVEALCGDQNRDLKQYGLTKVINTKIIGAARGVVLEIPEDRRTWETVVETLTVRFRPKKSIHQLLFQAKEIKVENIKDLFEKLTKIKSECNEICDFNNEQIFTYTAIDKELVHTLKSKLTPIVQLQVNSDESLFNLENYLCRSEIYLSDEAIKSEYKKNKNYTNKNYNNNQINRTNHNNQNNNHNKNNNGRNFSNNNSYNNFRQNYNNNNNQQNSSGQYRQNNYNPQNRNYGRYGHNNNSFNNQQNQPTSSGQTRNYNNNRHENVPMEVDNINREEQVQVDEVNFQD